MRFHCPRQTLSPPGLHQPSSLLTAHLDALKERTPQLLPFPPVGDTHRVMGSAFTPIIKSTDSAKDLSSTSKSDLDKDSEDQKRTPPSVNAKDLSHTSSGLPRTLFPDAALSPPTPHTHLLAAAANPLLRYYQSLYPAAVTSPPQLSLAAGGFHPQLLQAYRSLLPMYPLPGAHPPPTEVPRLSPPHASPLGMVPVPHGHGGQHHHVMPSFFPMPSDKDGEPLDLLPKSLYMNKARHGKGHLCIYCGKMYSRKYGLKIHLRTHTGYKPLKCKVCLRPFGDPSNLNKHIRLHAEGETPYRCDFCGKVLVRRRDLERHVKSRHPNEWGIFEAKKAVNELQNKSVDIDANDNEVGGSDNTDNELEELVELEEECCEDEIEVD